MYSIQLKFHSIVISLTTLIFFSVYESANRLIEINPIYKILLSTLASLALYRIIAKILLVITTKSKFVRKQILGPRYMEGTWVGFYIGVSGKVRYLVEHYEQDIFQLVVRGHSYKDDSSFHTSWRSKPVNIDIETGEISYMYDLKGIGDNTNGNGIAFFNFSRANQYSPPTELKGFSADLHNSQRTKSIEVKISHNHKISDTQALIKAIDFYETNKDNF